MSDERGGPVRVVVTDVASGKILDDKIVENDYALIMQGNRYVKSIQVMGRPGRATHMIAVAVKP